MSLHVDKSDFDQLVNGLSNNIVVGLKKGMAQGMDYIGIVALGKRMINPGGETAPVNAERITSRSGRVARSLSPQGGAFNPNAREQIRRIEVKGNQILGEFGSAVEYLVAHEYGLDIVQTVSARQKSFFWAKWYESGKTEEKWKRAALSETIHIKVPARPVLEPAVEMAERRVYEIFDQALDELLNEQA